MFIGELSHDDERILIDIMHNYAYYTRIDDEILFTVGSKQHIVEVTYQHRPMDRVFYDDIERTSIIKRCIIVELNGVKLTIFKFGDVFHHICLGSDDITHLLYIKSRTASQFYTFVIQLFDEQKTGT